MQSKSELSDFLHEWLTHKSSQEALPAFTVAVSGRDGLWFSRAYGHEDPSRWRPLTPQTVFPISSQSKMFTATIVMLLVQEGKIVLEDAMLKYLPWLAEHRDPGLRMLTVGEVLLQRSGLVRDGDNADYWQLQRPFPDAVELQRIVLESDLVTRQMATLKYSNIGYALLGSVIEAACGESYEAVAQRLIIEPLGLKHTFIIGESSPKQRIVTGYRKKGERPPFRLPAVSTGALRSAVGWCSTAEDMCRFASEHFYQRESLLAEDSRHFVHTNTYHHWRPRQLRGSDYGFGFQRVRIGKRQLVGHGGTFTGHRSATYFDPEAGIAVAVMANTKDAPIVEMAMGVWGVVDYFTREVEGPTPAHLAPFTRPVSCLWTTLRIVPGRQRLVAACLDKWLPFEGADELEVVDERTLRIVKAHDFAAQGELVRFQETPQGIAVNFSGYTFVSAKQFRQQLAKLSAKIASGELEGE